MPSVASLPLPLELRNALAGLATAKVADDQQWLLSLMRKHGLTVITLLWRMLGSEQDVLDAYQTTISRMAVRGRQALKSNPAGYFYRTASNTAIETLRARERQRRHWPAIAEMQARKCDDSDDCKAIDHRETLDRLRHAISQLPPYLRNVIVLRELAEMPYGRVCQILGIGTGTARLYRRQAILRLAELMGVEALP